VTPNPLHAAIAADGEAATAVHKATAKHAATTLGRRSGTSVIEATAPEPAPD
jgi:hypothetical protein